MFKFICLLGIFVGLLSCTRDSNSDPNVFEGIYITNPGLDFSCALLPADKLPTLSISPFGINRYSLVLTTYIPEKSTTLFSDITLVGQQDKQLLTLNGSTIGSWGKSPFDDAKRLVRLQINNPDKQIYFIGQKK